MRGPTESTESASAGSDNANPDKIAAIMRVCVVCWHNLGVCMLRLQFTRKRLEETAIKIRGGRTLYFDAPAAKVPDTIIT